MYEVIEFSTDLDPDCGSFIRYLETRRPGHCDQTHNLMDYVYSGQSIFPEISWLGATHPLA